MIHGHEKSGLAPGLRRGRRRSGEPRERRRATVGGGRGAKAGAKGNTSQTDTRRTPSRASVSPGLERVGTAARLNKEERFTALLHHVDIDLLRQAYLWLKREAAPGVDGVTWVEYGQGLEEKLEDLHGRVHRGATARCRRGADISRSRMDGSGRWASRHWRTRSSSVRMVEVLNAIYEEDFLGFSYGFPPGRSQHDAPRVKPVGGRLTDALAVGITRTRVDWILDADIRSF